MKKIYPIAVLILLVCNLSALAQTYTFTCPDTTDTWTVPPGVTSILVDMQGATGGENSIEGTGPITVLDRGGNGARVQGTLAVTPGQVLHIYIGGAGPTGITGTNVPGGYNGGGGGMYAPLAGITPDICGGGGGGASDIRIGGTALTNRVMIAGGGGGAGGNYVSVVDYDRGGDGGTTTGEAGWAGNILFGTGAGGPGSTGSGGTGGVSLGGGLGAGISGISGIGGNAGINSAGGGGGGGYYGGGGSCYSGGGGGSSYTDPVLVTSVTQTRGYNSSGCGDVILCVTYPGVISGDTGLCTGQSLPLSETVTGGVWSSSNPTVASIGTSGIVTALTQGIVNISYTVTTVCATSITSVSLQVGQAPAPISGVDSVCLGNTISLGDAVPGGAWSSSDTAVATVDPTGLVSSTHPGTATITYTMPVGNCISIIPVKFKDAPIAPVRGADSVCVSGTAYYTDIVGIGSWSSTNPGVATIAPVSGLLTGVSAGTAIISFLSNAGCLAKDTIRVIDLPRPIYGVLHVCPGASTTAMDSTAGGVWNIRNASVATTGPTGKITGIIADTTSVLYTIKPGCSVNALVVVNPIPLPITGRDTVCPGITDTLFDASPGGVWASSTPLIDTIVDTTGIVATLLSGNGVISYTLPTGCTITKSLNVYATPTPVITWEQATNTFYTATGYSHYQWYDSISGKIPHATSPTLAGIYTQWYYVVVTDTNGCLSPSAVYHFNLDKLGVNNVANMDIKVYPNPGTGIVNIECPVNVRAVVNAIDGKTEMDKANAKYLDISRLAAGVYLISLYDDNGMLLTTRKLIKD